MKNLLKKFIKNNLYLNAILYIYYNILIHIKIYLKNNNTDSGTTHKHFSLQESIDYINQVFFDYKKVSEINNFYGKIAEIGPGDSNGVALMFLANGASSVDLADRFYSLRNQEQQDLITNQLLTNYPKLQNINIKQCHTRYYGEQSSGEKFFDYNSNYDFIVSRSVLEHVDNPELVLNKMYNALNPNGMLIHKIDLRDHEMFTPFSYKLKFLEIPKFIYNLMTYGSGFPNRFLFNGYKEIFTKFNKAAVKFYVSGLYGMETDNLDNFYDINEIPVLLKTKAIDFVNKYKHKFSKEIRSIPTEDLIISSFFVVCKKLN